MYLTPGRNPVVELLRSSIDCQEIWLEKGANPDEKITEIVNTARARKIPVNHVERKQLVKLLNDPEAVHQGVVAKAHSFAPNLDLKRIGSEKLGNQLYIYIREALYEHNAAAITRSAECLGVSGVIFPPQIKITPNFARIAMGANFHIPVAKESLFNVMKIFRKGGFQIVSIEINGTKQLDEVNFNLPSLLIVGGEDHSISKEIAEKSDVVAQINQFGKVNSLNMSVAASLAMYERVRQLGK